MEEILHQLFIYRVLYIPGGAGFLPSTVSFNLGWNHEAGHCCLDSHLWGDVLCVLHSGCKDVVILQPHARREMARLKVPGDCFFFEVWHGQSDSNLKVCEVEKRRSFFGGWQKWEFYDILYSVYKLYKSSEVKMEAKAKAAQMIHSGWFKFQGKPLDFFGDIDSFSIIFPLTHWQQITLLA